MHQPKNTITRARQWIVDRNHPQATDGGQGTADAPFLTINAAAQVAHPGDTVVIHAGVYRERISPARGGQAGQPITYCAADDAIVCVRGSEIFAPAWQPLPGRPNVFSGSLESAPFGAAAYHGVCDPALYGQFNPFHLHFNRGMPARPQQAVIDAYRNRINDARTRQQQIDPIDIAFADAGKRIAAMEADLAAFDNSDENARRYLHTLGQVFVNGQYLTEVETLADLTALPGTWMVDEAGQAILLHPPTDVPDPAAALVEISLRHTAFAPLARGLGYITLRGLIFEHAANHFPTWGKTGWGQAGLVSTRTGHHWIIENCTIRYAKSVGLDCGSEGGSENKEHGDSLPEIEHHQKLHERAKSVGYHLIRNNRISDNGHCGIAGIGHYGTQVLYNTIERNNRDGWTSPWWEFAGIKFHYFFDGLIEGNIIRDNEAHGIWIDNQWRGSRITRNVILNNLWSGINVELGRGPVMIDHNIIALTRQGDGVYGHDVADVTIAHNLIYANSNFGVWFAYATPRVKPEDGCWDIKTLNNLILGNRAGAIAYPLPWDCAGNNTADGNLYMGAGEYLDEGGGPQPPLFQINNRSHCGFMPKVLGPSITAQTDDVVWDKLAAALEKAGLPRDKWPAESQFKQQYLLSFEAWQAATGNDARSRTTSMIRDGLASQILRWRATLDDAITSVRCAPVDGLSTDYARRPLGTTPLPGPFQSLTPGVITQYLLPRP